MIRQNYGLVARHCPVQPPFAITLRPYPAITLRTQRPSPRGGA
ncbi:MAG: hypothetical protein ACYDHX_00905 [Methanothrix sp.]